MASTASRLRAERARRARAAKVRAAERRRLAACRKQALKRGRSVAACKPRKAGKGEKAPKTPATPSTPAVITPPAPTAPSIVVPSPPVAGPAAPSTAQPLPAPSVPVGVAVPTTQVPTTPAPTPTTSTPAPTTTATTPTTTATTPTTTAPAPATTPWGPVTFGRAQATRLLWRAGFGPAAGDVDRLVALGLDGAVESLVSPPAVQLTGAPPRDQRGVALDPKGAWGNDQVWWLDRMVRSNQPLVERMTLVWHDWFATSVVKVGDRRPMLTQNATMRSHALGAFPDLLRAVTADPAMLSYLDGWTNRKWAVNENYGREVMELFTLGAGRGAYTEKDVREIARAFTGFGVEGDAANDTWKATFDQNGADTGSKTIFGKTGRFDWKDACRLLVEHDLHPSFFVTKLWSSFIPTAPDAATLAELQRIYVAGGREVKPVLRAILKHPDLHHGQSMVKPPVVYIAGMLRAIGRTIDVDNWHWLLDISGQSLFNPPNVSGWDDTRWMNSATWLGRATACAAAIDPLAQIPWSADLVDRPGETPVQAVDRALSFWGNPPISADVRDTLILHARRLAGTPEFLRWPKPGRGLRQNSLRLLIGTSSDAQIS